MQTAMTPLRWLSVSMQGQLHLRASSGPRLVLTAISGTRLATR